MIAGSVTPLKCKECGGAKVRRSHRAHIWETALSMIGLYPYRCHDCDARFFRNPTGKHGKAAAAKAEVKLPRETRWERKQLKLHRTTRLVLLYGIGLVLFAVVAFYYILRPPPKW